MKNLFFLSMVFTTLIVIQLITSCNKDKIPNSNQLSCDLIDPTSNTYNKTIKPIFNNNCSSSGCHDAASSSANIILDNYTSVKDAVANKTVLCAIKYETSCSPMPPTGKINDTLINYINCWKESGFPQ